MLSRTWLAALALAIAASGAQAQSQTEQESADQSQTDQQTEGDTTVAVIAITEWDYQDIYDRGHLQAEKLMDTEVFGPEGEEIGSVENIVLDADNQIIGIIAQVGGLWDIGDTHIAVPWEDVSLTDDGVQIPVTEESVDDYNLYGPQSILTKEDLQQTAQVSDDVVTGARSWKITDILNDYVALKGGEGYGYIDNVIFSEDGKIEAVVVEATSTYGSEPYAYPFYGFDYDWEPGYQTYILPYEEDEVADLEPFDYEQLEDS